MKPTEAISFGFKVEFLSIIASVMAAKKEIAIEAEGFIEANSFGRTANKSLAGIRLLAEAISLSKLRLP